MARAASSAGFLDLHLVSLHLVSGWYKTTSNAAEAAERWLKAVGLNGAVHSNSGPTATRTITAEPHEVVRYAISGLRWIEP